MVNDGVFVPGQTVVNAFGTLTITGFTPTFNPDGVTVNGGTISYSYVLNRQHAAPHRRQ